MARLGSQCEPQWQNLYMDSDAAFIDDTPESSSEQLDQQGPADSLIYRGVDEPLDEGYTAPEVDTIAGGGHNFATLTARAAVEEKTAAFIKAHL